MTTETNTVDTTTASTVETSSQGADTNNTQTNTNPETSASATPPAFTIPDAYKEKPWADKVKTPEDLWKQLDNAQSLIGKKTVAPDFSKATPKEIEEYFKQTRPADKAEYAIEAGSDEEKAFYQDLFHKNGISSYQANNLAKEFQANMQKQKEAMYDKEAFKASAKEMLGDDYQALVSTADKIAKENLPADSYNILMEEVPNKYLLIFHQFANNLIKDYGVTEKGQGSNYNSGGNNNTDIETTRADLRKQINELSSRPHHTEAEKLALINKLSDTYKTKTK